MAQTILPNDHIPSPLPGLSEETKERFQKDGSMGEMVVFGILNIHCIVANK
ncbi:MAG: hypothetical protein QMD22_07685 [archaeon]|nr:hypothetical protein [archaeon]